MRRKAEGEGDEGLRMEEENGGVLFRMAGNIVL